MGNGWTYIWSINSVYAVFKMWPKNEDWCNEDSVIIFPDHHMQDKHTFLDLVSAAFELQQKNKSIKSNLEMCEKSFGWYLAV